MTPSKAEMTDREHAVSHAASILRLAGAELTDETLDEIHGCHPLTLEDLLERLFPGGSDND